MLGDLISGLGIISSVRNITGPDFHAVQQKADKAGNLQYVISVVLRTPMFRFRIFAERLSDHHSCSFLEVES